MYLRGFTSLPSCFVRSLPVWLALGVLCCSADSAEPAALASAAAASGAAGRSAAAALEPPAADPEGSLCAKYGGMANVREVTEQLLERVTADCRIRAFFAGLTSAGGQRVRDCLALQIGELFGCAGVSYDRAYADNGLECRGMRKSHIGLGISDADFDALIEDVGLALAAAGIVRADIEAAAAGLLALRPQIVEVASALPSRSQCASADAGQERRE